MMTTTPSPSADALLRLFLPADDAEAISGDLQEMWRGVATGRSAIAGRWWYWRQVIGILWAHLSQPPLDPIESRPERTTMASLRQDLTYALRSLRKQPAFTSTAVLMLALGIGANVAIFALVNAVLFKPLPFAEPGRLMIVHLLGPDFETPGVFRHFIWSYPKYVVFRDNQRAFESTAAFNAARWNLTGSESPEQVIGEQVESTYFGVLGVDAQLGRIFSAQETRSPGSAPIALLGHGIWMRRFGRDPSVTGRTIGLNGVPHTIVGVLPPGFTGLTGQAEVWVPVMTLSAADLGEKWNHSYTVVARRKADVTATRAESDVKLLGAQIDREIPDFGRRGTAWSATAVALDDERVDPLIRRSILLLLAAVVAVLLIVCVNLSNLTLVRGLSRQREIAIRLALGASRGRVIRQLMTESLLLAVLGSMAGLAVAYGAMSAGAALMPDLATVLPRGQTGGLIRVGLGLLGVDGATLVFTCVVAACATVLFGLAPAWATARRDLSVSIKAGSSGAVSGGSRRLSVGNLLLIGEVALALVLLTAGGLMLKSVARLQATELGFNPRSLLSVRVTLPAPQYDPPRATRFLVQLLERLDGVAGLDAVAYGNCPPVSGGCNKTTATFPERPAATAGSKPTVGILWVSPRYFDTLAIRLIRGRLFTDQDRVGQPKVVVINETAARAFWNNEDPIGRRIAMGQGGFQDGAEVVGVVGDVRYGAIETSVGPDVYLPLLQSTRSSGFIFVRSRASAESIVPIVRQEVQALDRDLPLTDIKMMEQRFGEATWRTRMSAWLLGVFSALALLLAALGIYGVISQGVQQRTREIGVRMALGAERSDILRLIIVRVVVMALAGVAFGVLLAIPAMRMLSALLYQVTPGDPLVFATLSSLLLCVAVLAGYVPARRATRVDPLNTLRAE